MQIHSLNVCDYDDSYQILFTLEDEDLSSFYENLNNILNEKRNLSIRKAELLKEITDLMLEDKSEEEEQEKLEILMEEMNTVEKEISISNIMKELGANILSSTSNQYINFFPDQYKAELESK